MAEDDIEGVGHLVQVSGSTWWCEWGVDCRRCHMPSTSMLSYSLIPS